MSAARKLLICGDRGGFGMEIKAIESSGGWNPGGANWSLWERPIDRVSKSSDGLPTLACYTERRHPKLGLQHINEIAPQLIIIIDRGL